MTLYLFASRYLRLETQRLEISIYEGLCGGLCDAPRSHAAVFFHSILTHLGTGRFFCNVKAEGKEWEERIDCDMEH